MMIYKDIYICLNNGRINKTNVLRAKSDRLLGRVARPRLLAADRGHPKGGKPGATSILFDSPLSNPHPKGVRKLFYPGEVAFVFDTHFSVDRQGCFFDYNLSNY